MAMILADIVFRAWEIDQEIDLPDWVDEFWAEEEEE
jgi:hypothetical protein